MQPLNTNALHVLLKLNLILTNNSNNGMDIGEKGEADVQNTGIKDGNMIHLYWGCVYASLCWK